MSTPPSTSKRNRRTAARPSTLTASEYAFLLRDYFHGGMDADQATAFFAAANRFGARS